MPSSRPWRDVAGEALDRITSALRVPQTCVAVDVSRLRCVHGNPLPVGERTDKRAGIRQAVGEYLSLEHAPDRDEQPLSSPVCNNTTITMGGTGARAKVGRPD